MIDGCARAFVLLHPRQPGAYQLPERVVLSVFIRDQRRSNRWVGGGVRIHGRTSIQPQANDLNFVQREPRFILRRHRSIHQALKQRTCIDWSLDNHRTAVTCNPVNETPEDVDSKHSNRFSLADDDGAIVPESRSRSPDCLREVSREEPPQGAIQP